MGDCDGEWTRRRVGAAGGLAIAGDGAGLHREFYDGLEFAFIEEAEVFLLQVADSVAFVVADDDGHGDQIYAGGECGGGFVLGYFGGFLGWSFFDGAAGRSHSRKRATAANRRECTDRVSLSPTTIRTTNRTSPAATAAAPGLARTSTTRPVLGDSTSFLHLHGLYDQQALAGFDGVALGREKLDDFAGHGRGDLRRPSAGGGGFPSAEGRGDRRAGWGWASH